MSSPSKSSRKEVSSLEQDDHTSTIATFTPTQTVSGNGKTKTLLVQKKSPLLISTPPQITRALAFSHPFLLPLSRLVGYLTWTSGDPWESFLFLACFWAVVLYGDNAIRMTGPLLLVGLLMAGMYSRRYSPLSTKSAVDLTIKRSRKGPGDEGTRHQKSLDEIVEALNVFTTRCNILVEPFLQLTDFLSTQVTATTATTRPALTSLLVRILMLLPIWFGLSLRPLCIITSQRVVLIVGTIILTWHSQQARIFRSLLWRSLTVRRVVSVLTGLEVPGLRKYEEEEKPELPPRRKSQNDTANSFATKSSGHTAGVRFTFVVFENQRRWLGLGWTSSMFAYERAAWTDEHLNASPPKDKFQLPQVETGHAVWRWVPASEWKIEGSSKNTNGTPDKSRSEGWVYYDNKWNDPRRQDGWGRYTRRRKWFRDAELVEEDQDPSSTIAELDTASLSAESTKADTGSIKSSDKNDASETPTKRRGFFRTQSRRSTQSSNFSRTQDNEGADDRNFSRDHGPQENWLVSDDMKMGLS